MALPTIPAGSAILISAIGIILTLLASFYFMGKWIGTLSNKLDSLDGVSKLSTQIETLTSTFNVSSAASIPDNIDSLSDDMSDVAGKISVVDNVEDSLDNIEAAITSVDLKGIEEAIEELFKNEFGEGLPMGNSVHHTMERSGMDVAISLTAMGDEGVQVTFRFEEDVKTSALSDLLDGDDGLGKYEEDLFDNQSNLRVPSPRQIDFLITSTDMDKISHWVPTMVERLDYYIIESGNRTSEFDEKVKEALQDSEP